VHYCQAEDPRVHMVESLLRHRRNHSLHPQRAHHSTAQDCTEQQSMGLGHKTTVTMCHCALRH